MLDLSVTNPSKAAEEGYEFNIVLPDGTETEATIKVRGNASPKVREYGRRTFREMQVREQAALRRGKPVEQPTLEELEEKAAESASIRVISWDKLGEDGKLIPFTEENAKALFKKYPFIRDQVIEESDNVHNFRC